jgi:hypothetical protein
LPISNKAKVFLINDRFNVTSMEKITLFKKIGFIEVTMYKELGQPRCKVNVEVGFEDEG